jgi:hypothetical protein
MAVNLIDLVTSYTAKIDIKRRLSVALDALIGDAGFVALGVENDPGTVTGTRYTTPLDSDDDFRLRVGTDSIIFSEPFAGAALNSAQWSSTVTTFATAVSGSYLKVNSGASAAASGVARIQSYRTFSVEPSFPLYIEFPIQYVAAGLGILNSVVEAGWFIATGTAAPTDGVFLRWNAAGELRLVCSFGGAEVTSVVINATSIMAVNSDAEILLVINTTEAELWIDNDLVAVVQRGASAPGLTVSQALPISFRVYDGATPPASAVQLWVGTVAVSRGGVANQVPASDASALAGWGGYQGQSGGTMGPTANAANSAAPASATLANATAGYATHGGQFQFAAVAGAETDYALFAYLVPAASAGAFNRNLLVRGIRIDTYNTGAAVATSATVLQWSIGVGATAVTLATVADTATAKQSRRIPLGAQNLQIGAAIGAQCSPIDIKFASALPVEPGTYIHVILKMPVGTATASQIIRGTVFLDTQYAL